MFHFPSWTLTVRDMGGAVLLVAPLYIVGLVAFGASPKTTDVGYQPDQPIEFSHALHAGQLGMDCRYCHNTVEKAAHAAVPPAATCMNCHAGIKTQSPKLQLLRDTYENGEPIAWQRVHDLPDYAYFDHSAHVTRGIGCASCHGRIDKMEKVWQEHPLSMGWCLDCHRNPEDHLRPLDQITNMTWAPENQREIGLEIKAKLNIAPSQNCSTCHR
ncbi:MAG: cytochrome C [Planctomycetaceae bacterium]|nr:cytochrome C [Planctomycetaceae bacterium]